MTNPSSLIFVAIVLLWAGWLLQHQIRRRQLLLTARNVETFSEAMRVLERRTPLATAGSSLQARPSLRAGSMLHNESREYSEIAQPVPAAAAADEMNEVAMTADTPASHTVEELLERVGRVARTRRTRGIALLVTLGLFPITLIAVLAGALSALALFGSLLLIAAVVFWLRAETVAEARRSGRAAPARPQFGRNRQPADADHRDVRRGSDVRDGVIVPEQWSEDVPESVGQVPDSVVVSDDVPFDGSPAPVVPERTALPTQTDETPAPAPATQRAAAADDGTWSPVRVPKPTYTMKAKAPERPQAPAASYENTPVEELPFDGLALDPEDEDLPPAFRAG